MKRIIKMITAENKLACCIHHIILQYNLSRIFNRRLISIIIPKELQYYGSR